MVDVAEAIALVIKSKGADTDKAKAIVKKLTDKYPLVM